MSQKMDTVSLNEYNTLLNAYRMHPSTLALKAFSSMIHGSITSFLLNQLTQVNNLHVEGSIHSFIDSIMDKVILVPDSNVNT